jgi:hypothetical protein
MLTPASGVYPLKGTEMKSKQKSGSKQSASGGSKQSGYQGSRSGSEEYSSDQTLNQARQGSKTEVNKQSSNREKKR